MRPAMNLSRFSNRTLAELTERVASAYSHSEIDLLLARLDAKGADEDDYGNKGNKLDRARRLVESLAGGDSERGGRVLDLLRDLLERTMEGSVLDRDGTPYPAMQHLVAGLRADGFDFVNGRVVAATPDAAPVAQEISLLESELLRHGFDVAAQHYRQAVDSFTDVRLEASNGQLRSCLEDVLIQLCGHVLGESAGDPKGAIDKLRSNGAIDGDEAILLKGLVGMSNERGAHHGLTNEAEATFRLHMTTAVTRYLLARVRQDAMEAAVPAKIAAAPERAVGSRTARMR